MRLRIPGWVRECSSAGLRDSTAPDERGQTCHGEWAGHRVFGRLVAHPPDLPGRFELQLSVVLPNLLDFRFHVVRSRAWALASKVGLWHRVPTGWPQFDRQFVVETEDPERFRVLFDQAAMYDLSPSHVIRSVQLVSLGDGLDQLSLRARVSYRHKQTHWIGACMNGFRRIVAALEAIVHSEIDPLECAMRRLHVLPDKAWVTNQAVGVRFDVDQARSHLLRQLAQFDSDRVTYELCRQFEGASPRVLRTLLEITREHPRPELREPVLGAMSRVIKTQEKSVLRLLRNVMRELELGPVWTVLDDAVRRGRAPSLKQLRSEEQQAVVATLHELLAPPLPVERVQICAAEALGELGDPTAVEAVLGLVRRLKDPQRRKRVRAVVELLEQRDRLPRPARESPSPRELPQAADGADVPDDSLPIPSKTRSS